MKELIINNITADLSEDIKIPLTYQTIDTSTPTKEHGAYSKSVVLKGTPTNNKIFSDAWSLERNVTEGFYDARKRIPFTLLSNGDIVDSGYLKLDQVTKEGDNVEYSTTLYSSIGDFFYNLAYNDEGEERTLSSLRYYFKNSEGVLMSEEEEANNTLFNWNKDFIDQGWNGNFDTVEFTREGNYPSDVIVAAPTYRGYYDDFSNDTVLAKYTEMSQEDQGYLASAFTSGYSSFKDYIILKATRDMDEWETRDLRSEYQRPSIPIRYILQAIGDPSNNGGYTVSFDNEILESPIYKKGHIIMDEISFDEDEAHPSLTELSIQGQAIISRSTNTLEGEVEITASTESTESLINPTVEISPIGTLQSPIDLGENAYTAIWGLFTSVIDGKPTYLAGVCLGGWHLRLDIYKDGTYYASSPEYFVHTRLREAVYDYKDFAGYLNAYIGADTPQDINFFEVELKRSSDNNYTWSKPLRIKMQVPKGNIEYKLVYQWIRFSYQDAIGQATFDTYDIFSTTPYYGCSIEGAIALAQNSEDETITNGFFDGDVSPNIQPQSVNKDILFNGEASPYDILIGFTKAIGARYVADAEKKHIDILLRKNFYEKTPLEPIIDWTKKEITPTLTEYKWYEYGLGQLDTYADGIYNRRNKVPYGHLKLDTTYEFNNETSNLFEDVVYTSLIPYRLNSIYFNDADCQVMISPTVDATTFKMDGLEIDSNETTVYAKAHFEKPYKVFDKVPKLCGFEKDNSTMEIGYTLALFNGFKEAEVTLSDNLPIMFTLNDNPCFLWTRSGQGYADEESETETQVAIKRNTIPSFSKYITDEQGTYTSSLDFLKPRNTFLGDDDKYQDGIDLYSIYHKKWIETIYNHNGLKIKVKARIPTPRNAVRKVYFFSNSYWLIEKIEDWEADKEFSTVTFVRIRNIDDVFR